MSAPPVNMLRCSICRRPYPAKMNDTEPLCSSCEDVELRAASAIAAATQVEISLERRALPLVVEHHVPVEHANRGPRPFGLGVGELPASRITHHLADEDRERLGGMRLAAFTTLCTLLGLIVLAVAAIR